MRTVTLEEHFVTTPLLRATGVGGSPDIQRMLPKLLDLGYQRIAAMDEAGIDVQVLSLAAIGIDSLSAEEAPAVLAGVNDELAAAVRAHPQRFAGFATLPLKTPDRAAQELERAVKELGFKGAMLDGTTEGKFLDDARFLPLFEAVQALDIPIYLHPAPPPSAVREAYYTGLPGQCGEMLSMAGWGWHAENALHSLRLIVSGLFDRLPKLRIVIGHMGENLPYFLARADTVLGSVTGHLQRPVAEYFHENFFVTTSGFFTLPPLRCTLDVVGIERTMFSVDYPFAPMTRGRDYLREVEAILTPEQFSAFSYGTAERLLRL